MFIIIIIIIIIIRKPWIVGQAAQATGARLPLVLNIHSKNQSDQNNT